jgi:hypothetical protein
MWYLILYTQWFACLSSIYNTNVAKNINLLFNNGYRGSFPSPQQAAGYSTEINVQNFYDKIKILEQSYNKK